MAKRPARQKWLLAGLVLVMVAGVGAVTWGLLRTSGSEASPVPVAADQKGESPAPGRSPEKASADQGQAITITGTGDVIMGTLPGSLPANGGKDFFKRVELTGDLIMGNLETPFAEDTGYKKCGPGGGCGQFWLPPSYAGHLKAAGFQLMNVANNHTLDQGPSGLASTRKALDAQGIKATGGIGEITVMEAKGVKVAVLGFAPYPQHNSLLDIPKAAQLVAKAKQQAQLVVVQMQIGAEGPQYTHVKPGTEMFLGENRGDPVAFARAMVDAGADLIIGHGPHVLRGMEFYKGRLIAYSMGNFAGYKVLASSGPNGVGGIVSATLRPDGSWVSGKLVPTVMVDGGYPAADPKKQAIKMVRDLSQADLKASAPKIAEDGSLSPQ
ncbi:CapA family protein [Longispora albida]|uniref:CapA family protein n=1 Tax=Longispora albida TaxID=203523 RepID=UPI0003825E99|nr:CapA family protein [Longispora albida]